ncbi:odorant receptor 67c-like [Melitaea cinxia]|uniref:odorant receptor 67c-like n=1 Tax=Melitaea cinxia TaxID=113334 RepID=UPI001E26F953|nr:odorant receptor 67c-like [Melitaea cinxia]
MLDENDVDIPIKLTKHALLLAGISIGDQRMKFLINLFYYFNLVWLYTDVIGEFFWLTDGIKLGKSLDELSMIAPCSTICLLATAKSLPIFFNKDTLETAVANLRNIHLKALNNIETTDGSFERKTVEDSLKFLNFIVYFLAMLCAVVVVIFSSLPLMLMGYDYYYNGEMDLKLPFLIQYFFDAYANTTIWGLVYFHQVWSTTNVCMNIFAVDTLFYAFCTYIQVHFYILGHHFENVICDSHDKTRERMRQCIKRHQELIKLVDQLEILYSKSTLFNILSSSLLICLSGFNITIVAETSAMLAFTPFLVVSLSQISLMCFYGDMLMASSTSICDAIYKCRWYDASLDIKKSITIVLFRARKPCKVTAANFAVLNLSAFTTILSRSWSYFALLKTMYD